MADSITIQVPGTTANLGPGYDCLGVALNIYNRVTVTRFAATPPHPMVDEAGAAFFEFAGVDPFPFGWEIAGDVPTARGLGSSVTVRLGILHALNELSRRPLIRDDLFQLCADLEGHPDNAAPGEFGGFAVAHSSDEGARCITAPVSSALKFVVLIPGFEVKTADARRVMPKSMPHKQAVASAINAANITAAFLYQQYELLSGCFTDYLHQPYRQPLVPILPKVIAAGEKAGAIGGFLSGSGSAIICVTLKNPKKVAAAMLAAAGKTKARVLIATADNEGARKAK
ncbi:MAG TPA: homoserine kinase [Chthoniobacteraceae bacterium]|nr:homoserine kinase [Chthoniobacteraceae bacterium]